MKIKSSYFNNKTKMDTHIEKTIKEQLTPDQIKQVADFCYKTNNRYAYLNDLNKSIPWTEFKIYNFVPTYDKWCLYCDNKNCSLRCSRCKYVYFCNEQCQNKAWSIHKKHCGRNLFTICITCGNNIIKDQAIHCENEKCKILYCSTKCKDSLHKMHLEFDCGTFIN